MTKVDRARVTRHTAIAAAEQESETKPESPKTRRDDAPARRDDRAPPSLDTRRQARARFDADSNLQLRAHRAQAQAAAKKKKDVHIQGTNGADRISVTQLADGRTRVDNNGAVTTYAKGRLVIIDAKGGDDRVRIGGGANVDVLAGNGRDRVDARRSSGSIFVDGGKGDDHLTGGKGDDLLIGAEGNDRLSGRRGNDQLLGSDGRDTLSGGDGTDVAHGGRGADLLAGGRGRDFLSGQDGVDILRGGDGNDTLSGNRGNDVLFGQRGDDVLIGGRDTDRVRGGRGKDIQYEGSVTIPKNIEIKGPAAFRRRVRDDLETLAATPSGRRLLDDLAARGHRVTIRDGAESYADVDVDRGELRRDGTPGPGAKSSRITYSPIAEDYNDGVGLVAPPTVLFHELVHVWNAATGTVPRESQRTDGVPNAEQIAVGLPIDHDNNPRTPRIQPNPYYENLIREELNIPRRRKY